MSKQVKRLRTLSSNKKGSIEIGINTIVIMVIAIVLLGLGVGFVKGIFNKMNGISDLVDVGDMSNPPTSSDPIRLSPSSVEVKRGDSKEIIVGVYNKGSDSDTPFELSIEDGDCSKDWTPALESISSPIDAGESQGFKVIVTLPTDIAGDFPQKNICKLTATQSATQEYTTQFFITATN